MTTCSLCARAHTGGGCLSRTSTGFGRYNEEVTWYCSQECRAIDGGHDVVLATTRQVKLWDLEWLIRRNTRDDDALPSETPTRQGSAHAAGGGR